VIDLGGGTTASYQTSAIVNCNAEVGYNPLPAVLAIGTIPDCLKRKIVATGTTGGVTRRVYEETRATASATVAAVIPFGNLITSVSLQPAAPIPGTLRECTPAGGTAADPKAGC
jgi:hypothetical protein